MKLERICTHAQAKRFLPEGGGDYGIVLMVRADDEACVDAIQRAADDPDGRDVHILDVERFSATSKWFGIADVPTFVVVADGALVALERGCYPGMLERLDASARALLCRVDEW